MGLTLEILGLIIFLGAHVFVSLRDRRAALISSIGRRPYLGLFSVVSIVGLILLGFGFARYRAEGLFRSGIRRHGPAISWWRRMWPASIAVVAAYIPGNIKRVLKHPMLVGVKLWAVAHLCANGDLGGIILFGGVLAWAVYDRISLKHRTDPGSLPIPMGGTRNDIIAIVIGTVLYAVLGLVFHPLVIGLPAFGTRPSDIDRWCVTHVGAEQSRRLTAPDIRARKGGEPIVCLTSYHAHTARILDSYCDFLLVGDSLGMVMHGLETTVPVTLEMMILQGQAVMRGSQAGAGGGRHAVRLLRSVQGAGLTSAARVLKETGCGAIKLEGGRRMAETIAFLVERGVPVMGHVGLTPQAINTLGSFRAQGRDESDWAPIEADAAPSPRPARSPSCWRRWPSRSRAGSRPRSHPDHRHRRARPATARSWCSRTCSACRRGCRNSSNALAIWDRRSNWR